jgi:thiamine biosynthesis lipoprotein
MTSAPDGVLGNRSRLDRRATVALLLSLVLLGTLTVWRVRAGSTPSVHELTGHTMGTSFNVKVDADLQARELDRVREVIEARFDQVNRLMSTYDSTSELSHFNRHLSTDPFPVSTELLEVLAMARDISERSGGAFDVTVAPLVDAWGFGPGERPPRTPDEPQLAALRESVGYRRILLDRAAGTVAKTSPETVVDLSAIAKGYGAERVTSDLLQLGLTRFLVEVGGELKAIGTRRDGRAWRVGIEVPDETARTLYGTVDLIDEAIATSGDYRNFRESEGVRYAHIIDPRTGSPIRFSGVSVSVVHNNAAMADAWATALTVLGPVVGHELAEREGIAALFVMRSNTAFRSRATDAFTERLGIVQEVGGR